MEESYEVACEEGAPFPRFGRWPHRGGVRRDAGADRYRLPDGDQLAGYGREQHVLGGWKLGRRLQLVARRPLLRPVRLCARGPNFPRQPEEPPPSEPTKVGRRGGVF